MKKMQAFDNDIYNSDIHNSIGFLVGRVSHRLKTEISVFLAKSDILLSSEELIVLTALEKLETPKRMGELAVSLGRDATTLKRQLNRLVKQNLVLREYCTQDSRAVVISITEKGRDLVEATFPMLVELREKALEGMSTLERETLLKSLSKVLTNLNDI